MSTEKPRQMKGFGGGRGGAVLMSPKQKIGRIYTDPEDDNNTELELQIRKETTTENPANWLAH